MVAELADALGFCRPIIIGLREIDNRYDSFEDCLPSSGQQHA